VQRLSPFAKVGKNFLKHLALDVPVYSYTHAMANLTGRIGGEQAAQGNTIPFADLLIGATALSLGFSVLTSNLRHFRLIPGLEVIPF
jgi:predicted nucleic acid-binding protein